MLLSKLCSLRTKEVPADAKMASHKLLLRAGYMKQVANGIYTLSALGQRACLKIENIIRNEMNKLDGQEVKFPVVMPKELWDLSGRYTSIGSEMARFEDRAHHKMLLGMTHEEASVHLAKNWISSYTQLPFMIYQIQTKFRDEPRSRGGLIRVREFTMKDAYSFHQTMEDLNDYYMKVHKGYENIYNKIGLKNFISVKSDTGMMGGSVAHEFMSINDAGEDELVVCDCGYKSNQEVAECVAENIFANETPAGEVQELFTGDAKTIEEINKLTNIDEAHSIKAVAYAIKGENGIVLAFVRGDKEVNEAKLKKATKKDIVPFSAENDSRLCAGNIGPINLNLDSDCIVVYDNSIADGVNMICGANKTEYHLVNVCVKRDLKDAEFVDIAKVQEGDTCPICGGKVKIVHGIEIGNIFQLGTKYTKSMDMTVHSEDGGEFNPIMGCYGIGVGRALACIIEDNHDNFGIIMPKEVAPFMVHICPLRLDNETVKMAAENLYKTLEENDISCIYDDRDVSAGNKFADADLLGMPFRIVVSQKGLDEGKVEIKIRATGEVIKTEPENVLKTIKDLI